MNLKEMQAQILSHRGIECQLDKLQEELYELDYELNWHGKDTLNVVSTFTNDFLSEFADVKNMMSQIEMIMTSEEIGIVERIQKEKCQRELDRIRTEKQ